MPKQNILFSFDEVPENDVSIFRKYLPSITKINRKTPTINIWDVPHSIKKLSYLVHGHYRYYGKFPSVIAGQILDQFPAPSPKHYVLDNFCGSGTTLVEAKLRNINSYGLDISWLSVLASNVKVQRVDLKKIQKISAKISEYILSDSPLPEVKDAFALKWFENEIIRDLKKIQNFLLSLKASPERDFVLIAFIGIIRRVSKAYDAEVRPHINKGKRSRDVLSAFSKKIIDMSKNHKEFMDMTLEKIDAKSLIGDNISLPEKFSDGNCYLVLSHPPYLNSFNYSPVYSLEYYWAKPWELEHTGGISDLHKTELKAHPATEKITEDYFLHLKKCYEETFRIQPKGGHLAAVIGDCTRNGKLIDVIGRLTGAITDIGYKLVETNFRTTHYGLGKYAYKDRADYHGNDAEKKDAIIIFKKA